MNILNELYTQESSILDELDKLENCALTLPKHKLVCKRLVDFYRQEHKNILKEMEKYYEKV